MALDQYGGFLIAAFAITCLVLGGYGLYLRSRLSGLHRALEGETPLQGERPARSAG